jgi:vacuolar-type H+-ATPase subunit C/Vma6
MMTNVDKKTESEEQRNTITVIRGKQKLSKYKRTMEHMMSDQGNIMTS